MSPVCVDGVLSRLPDHPRPKSLHSLSANVCNGPYKIFFRSRFHARTFETGAWATSPAKRHGFDGFPHHSPGCALAEAPAVDMSTRGDAVEA